jgi:hypothetical protein
VPGTDWDAVSTVLLNLHRSLIRSKLDYIYTDVSFTVHPVHRISSCLIQSIIKDYDCPFQRSERLQLGVSMLNQTGFGNRRIKLGMQYASKLKAYPSKIIIALRHSFFLAFCINCCNRYFIFIWQHTDILGSVCSHIFIHVLYIKILYIELI